MEKSVARDLAFVKSKVISRLLESDEFAKVMLRKEDFTDDEKNDMEYKPVSYTHLTLPTNSLV